MINKWNMLFVISTCARRSLLRAKMLTADNVNPFTILRNPSRAVEDRVVYMIPGRQMSLKTFYHFHIVFGR